MLSCGVACRPNFYPTSVGGLKGEGKTLVPVRDLQRLGGEAQRVRVTEAVQATLGPRVAAVSIDSFFFLFRSF